MGFAHFEEALEFVQNNQCVSACYAATGLATGVAVVPAVFTGMVLPALGFAAGGIVKSSLAAGWQSSIGNAVARSLFSTLQSAGASGYGAPAVAGAVTTVASSTAAGIGFACAKVCAGML